MKRSDNSGSRGAVSSLVTGRDGELFSFSLGGELEFRGRTAGERVEVSVRCAFRTAGQLLAMGVLDSAGSWGSACGHGLAVAIDTEDGAVTDLVNDQGVIDYLESAPLHPDEEVELGLLLERQGRVLIPRVRVGEEAILHPAIYLPGCERLSFFVGTTILWGGSANFSEADIQICPDPTEALSPTWSSGRRLGGFSFL